MPRIIRLFAFELSTKKKITKSILSNMVLCKNARFSLFLFPDLYYFYSSFAIN